VRLAWGRLVRLARDARDLAAPRIVRARERVGAWIEEIHRRLTRITLGTRLFLVLVSMAAATSAIIVLLQDSSLSSDLQRAARTRLGQKAEVASQLLDDHLTAQYERYSAVSETPQFIANLESGNVPTLEHYSGELADLHDARVILFTDEEGQEVAGYGERKLRKLAHRHLDGLAPRIPVPSPRGTTTALVEKDGVPYSIVNVPLHEDGRVLGSLVSVEAIGFEELSAWSRLCRARITVDEGPVGQQLSQSFRPAGRLHFRVAISYDDERQALANSRKNALTGGFVGLALATLASLLLARSLVRPIRAIKQATEQIASGDLEFRLDTRRSDEVGDVSRGFNFMLERLDENIRERVRVENQISHLAYHDALTGFGNRRLLEERLSNALELVRTGQSQAALMFLDLDRFKDVNDSLGHTAGDELLVEVAQRIDGTLGVLKLGGPESEEPVFLARLGGDEFTVLMTDVEDADEVALVARRVLRSLEAPMQLRGQEVRLSASLGVALAPRDAIDPETILRYADMAMFHAKNRGGGGFEFYSDSMQEFASTRLALARKIQHALENEEFELYYQPKLELESGQVRSVEALLRWHDPVKGIVGPADFIPMAEETGAIVAIGDWVLREAVRQSVSWQEDGVPPVRVAVNVSARQLETGDDFAERVAEVLDESGLDPGLLDLEITEGAMLKDEEQAIELFEKLRDTGVGLALDDFGTGYSSLSYLRRLPINTLKIDRSFILGVEEDPDERALVESIITMAKSLQLRVVAEGVETRKQQRFLDELGCDEIQGYLFCKPVCAEEAAEFLSRKRRRRPRRKATATTRRRKTA